MKTFILISLILSAHVCAKKPQKLNFSVSDAGTFDVLYHRPQSTTTGVVIGGLIGGSIEEGVRKGKDVSKRNQLLEIITDSSCKERMLNSFVKKLEENDICITMEQDPKINKKSTFWLDVKIQKCGVKKANSNKNEVFTFVEYKTTVKIKNVVHSKERYSIVAKKKYEYEKLSTNAELLDAELTSVLIKAGKRLANKIIYQ